MISATIESLWGRVSVGAKRNSLAAACLTPDEFVPQRFERNLTTTNLSHKYPVVQEHQSSHHNVKFIYEMGSIKEKRCDF